MPEQRQQQGEAEGGILKPTPEQSLAVKVSPGTCHMWCLRDVHLAACFRCLPASQMAQC